MRRTRVTTFTLCSILLVAGCGEQPGSGPGSTPQPADSPGTPLRVARPPAAGSGTGATALTWTTPESWVSVTPSTAMRKAQYRIPGESGDAEFVVFYFGPGQGGTPMANAERWAGQFTLPDGRSGWAGAEIGHLTVGEIDVLTVEVAGTYQGGFRMQQQNAAPKPDQMLLGAIAEGPDANWFFKLTGPAATVESERAGFANLVATLERGS
jgi:hypothetical protein